MPYLIAKTQRKERDVSAPPMTGPTTKPAALQMNNNAVVVFCAFMDRSSANITRTTCDLVSCGAQSKGEAYRNDSCSTDTCD